MFNVELVQIPGGYKKDDIVYARITLQLDDLIISPGYIL